MVVLTETSHRYLGFRPDLGESDGTGAAFRAVCQSLDSAFFHAAPVQWNFDCQPGER